MTQRPIVHIGYHKTATSWFQDAVYPQVDGYRMVDRGLIRRTFLGGDAFDFDPAAARTALQMDTGLPPPILCEEDLSGFLHQGLASGYVAREAARRLHETLPDARIVIFVRAQPSAAVSWYLQYLREGGTASIRRYLFADAYAHAGHDRPFKLPRFDFSQIDYAGLIRRYDALFGAQNVFVIPYESLSRDREGTLRAMSERLGAPLAARSTKRVNGGYRRALMPLARAANLFTERAVPGKTTLVHLPYWYVVRKALFAQLNRSPLFGRTPKADTLLDQQTRDWIAQRFATSNRWLEQRIGEPLAALGYPLDPPPQPVDRPGRRLPLGWTSY